MEKISYQLIIFVFYFFLTIGFPGTASCADERPAWTLHPAKLAIGQVGLFSISDVPATRMTATFLNRPVYFHPASGSLAALLPVDISTPPGKYPLTIEYEHIHHGTKKVITIQVEVHPYEFPVEELTLPEKMVTFPEEILKRIQDEKEAVDAVFEETNMSLLWNGGFIKPVEGDIVGLFGSRRILNGEERSRHMGVDIRGKEGTPIRCANSGRVALASDFYLLGSTVILNHGQGVFTIYCHLSKAAVKEGQQVAKGESLGEIGATGRATGPHLHWGAVICGARVDPLSLIEATAMVAEMRNSKAN
ncbi:MAG: M23 family metallopeptidase [Desulfovibrionales bacterium]|nr:M23 family metallopeptidase [Desulfovibrionales bacterium]